MVGRKSADRPNFSRTAENASCLKIKRYLFGSGYAGLGIYSNCNGELKHNKPFDNTRFYAIPTCVG